MVAGKPEMLKGRAVGAQLVDCHLRRREGLLAEQLAHELDGRRPVSTTPDQDLEDLVFEHTSRSYQSSVIVSPAAEEAGLSVVKPPGSNAFAIASASTPAR
jgi:hypothetical protein